MIPNAQNNNKGSYATGISTSNLHFTPLVSISRNAFTYGKDF